MAAATLWGTTGTAATFAPPAASGVAIGSATMGLGGLILALLAPRCAALLRMGRGMLVVALPGAAAIAVYPLAFYSSMAYAGVAIGTVVSIGSSPVFAALLERLLEGVRLDSRWAVATAISAVGTILLVLGGHAGPQGGAALPVLVGVVLGLVAGATYAGYSYAARRLIQAGHPSRGVMGLLFGMGSILLLPVFALTGEELWSTTSGALVAGYLAVVPMGLAYVLFGAGLRHVGASTATTLSLVEPVVAAVLSVLVVGERLGVWSWIGAGLIGVGLLALIARR
ncbi:permease [Longimycelium tulufanense]|uniref:Permease n=1 Tax=Longimycelium tulufanense TaxID=907463 RepID=A0A8J3CI25_9PSEU|nr:permease [Longimycelium tulufanense]